MKKNTWLWIIAIIVIVIALNQGGFFGAMMSINGQEYDVQGDVPVEILQLVVPQKEPTIFEKLSSSSIPLIIPLMVIGAIAGLYLMKKK